MDEREAAIFNAKIAEQAERYDDMVEFMKKVVGMGNQLSVEERNLFSVAFKNIIGSRRSSWRIISSLESKESKDSNLDMIKQYKERVAQEVKDICNNVLNELDTNIIPLSGDDVEAKVFFLKMKGDYYRYLVEVTDDSSRDDAAGKSREVYEAAKEIAENLASTHPVRLGLALNFSVFYYEILNSPEEACKLAKTAFDDAIAELDNLKEESYKDSTLIMQLLRDNLTLWTSEGTGEGDEQPAE